MINYGIREEVDNDNGGGEEVDNDNGDGEEVSSLMEHLM